MYLSLGITRAGQVCWKSKQKDERLLSFGELSFSEKLTYSPSSHIFLILQVYTTSELKDYFCITVYLIQKALM